MTDQAENRSVTTSTHIAGALLGGALLGLSASRRGPLAATAKLTGASLVLAAFGPELVEEVRRAGAARRRVKLHTSVIVERPVHEVFDFFHDFENFPRVVRGLSRVVDHQDGRSHWEARAPTGELLSWDAVVTKYVPNVVIAWKSVPRSPVDSDGLIRFAPTENGGTRLDIEVHYEPGRLSLIEALSALFHRSRQRRLRADLAKANVYLRSLPHHEGVEQGAEVSEPG